MRFLVENRTKILLLIGGVFLYYYYSKRESGEVVDTTQKVNGVTYSVNGVKTAEYEALSAVDKQKVNATMAASGRG